MSDLILRVILLGDSNVGKTSLIMRYIKYEFKNSFISTIGVEYDSKIIKKGNLEEKLMKQTKLKSTSTWLVESRFINQYCLMVRQQEGDPL